MRWIFYIIHAIFYSLIDANSHSRIDVRTAAIGVSKLAIRKLQLHLLDLSILTEGKWINTGFPVKPFALCKSGTASEPWYAI